MQYAHWTNNNKFKEKLVNYDGTEVLDESGFPMIYDNNNFYINTHDGHNLVIGSTGSGKSQTVILPMARLSIKASESFVIHDISGEAYNTLSGMLDDNGYKVIAIDFKEAKYGNNWNPLTLPYSLYKNNDLDSSVMELENIAYYLFSDSDEASSFWNNSAIDYFVGLALYLFENAKFDEINLESIYNLANKIDDKFIDKIKDKATISYYLSAILKAPAETKGGIIATFNLRMHKYITRVNLANMLNYSDFDLRDIQKEKTAIFILSGNTSNYNDIIPLFINQVIDSIEDNNKKRLNILLDDFDNLLPIKDFSKLINNIRRNKVCITAIIRSFKDLENTYGNENSEILRMCFTNTIYLLSNDYDTLTEISKICGNTLADKKIQPLITVEELKVLNHFEALILMPREYPIRTKLYPDYKYNWGEYNKVNLPLRKTHETKIYSE